MSDPVQLPSHAVAPNDATTGNDLSAPSVALLNHLNLLPNAEDLKKAGSLGAAISGPPQSVAIIEAGASAASKVWATGLGASVIALWGSVRTFWNGEPPATQRVMLWGAAIASAAVALAISYILGSDVRGRAAAMVATIESRAAVAVAFVEAAVEVQGERSAAAATAPVEELPVSFKARLTTEVGTEAERGWLALLTRGTGEQLEYGLVKGTTFRWAPQRDVRPER